MSNEPGPHAHYFSESPLVGSAPSALELVLPDLRLALATDAGVFAQAGIDYGTKLLLLEGPATRVDDSVLVDLGAGYGPIALALAMRNPGATVYAIEINERARQLCVANAASAGLKNVVVMAPGEFPDGLEIDRIWSNPPIRIGKQALHDLLETWLGRLAPGGSAHLVVQKHLGADSLTEWIRSRDFDVSRRKSRKAYRLLDVKTKS